MKTRKKSLSKPPDNGWEIIPEDELKRRVLRYRGIKPSCKPPKGQRSTVLCVRDISYLAKVDRHDMWHWLAGVRNFGTVRLRRVSRIVALCDAGMVTKRQSRQYTIHDHPVAQPMRVMRVTLGKDGIGLTRMQQAMPPKTMPDWMNIFGGLKKWQS